jgi:hypothetical protein
MTYRITKTLMPPLAAAMVVFIATCIRQGRQKNAMARSTSGAWCEQGKYEKIGTIYLRFES